MLEQSIPNISNTEEQGKYHVHFITALAGPAHAAETKQEATHA